MFLECFHPFVILHVFWLTWFTFNMTFWLGKVLPIKRGLCITWDITRQVLIFYEAQKIVIGSTFGKHRQNNWIHRKHIVELFFNRCNTHSCSLQFIQFNQCISIFFAHSNSSFLFDSFRISMRQCTLYIVFHWFILYWAEREISA